jgi:outer membrane protein assembly factor BamB
MMKFKDTDMFVRFFCLFSILVLVFCAADVFAEADQQGLLISPALLKHAGLEMQWQLNLPVKTGEKVQRLHVFDDYLYVLTDHNYMFCLERNKGTMRFEQKLAVAGLPICGPKYYEGKLCFVIGNELLVLNPSAGAIIEKKRLSEFGKGSVCGFGRNSDYLYVVGSDKRIRVLVADEYWQKFSVTADNDSLINSIVVDEEFVVFATEKGNIIRIASDSPARKWQFDIPGRIKADVVRDGDSLYVGSDNTKLYKFDINTGEKIWPVDFQAGAVLSEPAVIGGDVVYQRTDRKTLYAIDKETGNKLWKLENSTGLMAEKGDRAYMLENTGVLVVMDNKLSKELYSVNISPVSRHATNTTDSQIYVSDEKGRLVGLNIKD